MLVILFIEIFMKRGEGKSPWEDVDDEDDDEDKDEDEDEESGK